MTSARAVPLRNPDGTVREWVGMNADITDLHLAGEALRRLNATLEQRVEERTLERDRIWRTSQDAFVVASLDGTYLSVSPAHERLLGWSDDEVLDKPVMDRVHPEDAQRTVAEFRRLASGLPSRGFENRMLHKDGSWRWTAWTAGVARDVTEEKARGEEIEAVNRQLVAQIEERERVEETLRRMQRLEAVGQLTSGVAHDFNNLLTVVLGNTAFVKRGTTTLRRPPSAARRSPRSSWRSRAGSGWRRGRWTSAPPSRPCATCCRPPSAAASGSGWTSTRSCGTRWWTRRRSSWCCSTWRSTRATPWRAAAP